MNAASKERWRDALGGTQAFGLFWSVVAGPQQPVWDWLASLAERTGNWAQGHGVPPVLAFLHAKVLAFLADDPVIALGCTLLLVGATVTLGVYCERQRIDQQLEERTMVRSSNATTRAARKLPEFSIMNRQVLCAGVGMIILLWAWARTVGNPTRPRGGIIICNWTSLLLAKGLPADADQESSHYERDSARWERVRIVDDQQCSERAASHTIVQFWGLAKVRGSSESNSGNSEREIVRTRSVGQL